MVRDVSIEIPAGEVTALLGPNGAGKSSLVLAVGGVLRPRAGSVLLDGARLRRPPPRADPPGGHRDRPRGPPAAPRADRRGQHPGRHLRAAGEQAQAGPRARLELFPELGSGSTAPARTLSGGEQQMVVLAQALVSQPRYLLIDELSLGLAPVIVNRLIPTIREVAESGIGVLLIEQFATVALGLANRAYIMEGGRIRFSGLASELREKPELLSSAYLLRGSSPP